MRCYPWYDFHRKNIYPCSPFLYRVRKCIKKIYLAHNFTAWVLKKHYLNKKLSTVAQKPPTDRKACHLSPTYVHLAMRKQNCNQLVATHCYLLQIAPFMGNFSRTKREWKQLSGTKESAETSEQARKKSSQSSRDHFRSLPVASFPSRCTSIVHFSPYPSEVPFRSFVLHRPTGKLWNRVCSQLCSSYPHQRRER